MSRIPKPRVFAGKTLQELDALTDGLDREFVADSFGPLTPAARRLWEKAKRKRGRPRVGKGAKVLSISIEKGLLARSDRAAKRLKISRAKLIATGLTRLLADLESAPARKPARRGRAA